MTERRCSESLSHCLLQVLALRSKGLDEMELQAVAALSDVSFVDHDLVAELILHIDRGGREGAVLCFMPGWEEIAASYEALINHPDVLSRSARLEVFCLHSAIPTAQQQAVFKPVAAGMRKVRPRLSCAHATLSVSAALSLQHSTRLSVILFMRTCARLLFTYMHVFLSFANSFLFGICISLFESQPASLSLVTRSMTVHMSSIVV